MQRTARPEGFDLPSPQLQRNHSISSDRRPSTSGSSALVSPPSVKPDPAYIASSAASQIINTARADSGQDSPYNAETGGEAEVPLVSPGSLILVNTFLDQLLFSFLASSRSTSIASLRPAILDVLKPRLGKEAIDGADEELQGYLAGGDAEELLAFGGGHDFKGEYDLNLIWRRTRLRCMVFTRLGDMEEEDEELYLEQEGQTETDDGRPRLSRDLGSLSPAAAIFLTSILEFIGEQALLVAGAAAFNRMHFRNGPSEGSRAVVEEADMEKIAFNTTLGRLWRSWKKRARSSSLLSPRPLSHDTLRQKSNSLSAGGSISGMSEEHDSGYFGSAQRPSVAKVFDKERGSRPITPVKAENLPSEPDFSGFSTTNSSPEVRKHDGDRPRSMVDYRRRTNLSPVRSPVNHDASTDGAPKSDLAKERPAQQRQRSSSLPAKQTPYVSPIDETFATPTEIPDHFRFQTDRANAEKDMPKLNDSKMVNGFVEGDSAVSTMYDGAITQYTEPLPAGMAERNDRGISTYTESSNYTDEYEHELAPEALNLSKATKKPSIEPVESPVSALSSDESLHVGELTPNGQPDDHVQDPVEKEDGVESYPSANRNDSVDSDQHVGVDLSTLQGHQLGPLDSGGSAVKGDIPVLYDTPPKVNHKGETSTGAIDTLPDEPGTSTPAKADIRPSNVQQSVPALTSLRELRDSAPDTSDEASSSTPSLNTAKTDSFRPTHRYQGSDGLRAISVSSSTFAQGQPRSSASKSVDSRSHPTAANTGTERAAVQKVSTSGTALSRTSTSSNRDARPMTAGSTTSHVSSKIKGMIGCESGDLIRQPMPNRTSSEGSGSLVKSPSKEQDFEDLIKSDETVKYTLTPQNMREMENPKASLRQTQSRSPTSEFAASSREATPTVPESDRPSTARSLSKLKGLNGLRANPSNSTSPTLPTSASSLSHDNAKAQPKPIPKSPGPRPPYNGPAREPIARDDSLRDFADFIRSTGPDVPPKTLQKPVNTNSAKSSRPSSSSSPISGAGKPLPKKITKQNQAPVPPKTDFQTSTHKKSLPKLQAREPTAGNSNETADLADFFRSGPAGGHVDRSQPPRTGAAAHPASQEHLTNGRMKEALNSGSSFASTQDSFAPSRMTQSSTNSRTGLLDSSNRSPHMGAASFRNNNNQQAQSRKDDFSGPVRTQHRNKDPYALDDDSGDENSFISTPQPPQPEREREREEESLSDFLRNYNPPPEATVTREPPTIHGAPKPQKPHNPSIKERLARNIAVVPDYRPLPPKQPKTTQPSSRSPPMSHESRQSARRTNSGLSSHSFTPPNQHNILRGKQNSSAPPKSSGSSSVGGGGANAPQLPPLNARATSPHLISQNGPPQGMLDNYRITQPTYAKHINNGSPRKHLQAREEGSGGGGKSGMSDLADFLRETEPPAPSGPVGGRAVSPVREKEKEGGFGRMFGRKSRK